MKNIIVQIYEVQDPFEAEALVEIGVDRIGSVIVSERDWKIPGVKTLSGGSILHLPKAV